MKHVTPQEFAQILLAKSLRPGMATFVHIKTLTDARLRKTGNPFPNVAKLTEMTVILNTEYVSGVTNQLKREGKDVATYVAGVNTMPLEFGPNNNFIGKFKDKFAIQYRPFEKSNPTVQYLNEGKLIAKEVIEPFLPKKKEHTAEESRQGTEKEIMWRKTYVENILEMTIDGETYKIIA